MDEQNNRTIWSRISSFFSRQSTAPASEQEQQQQTNPPQDEPPNYETPSAQSKEILEKRFPLGELLSYLPLGDVQNLTHTNKKFFTQLHDSGALKHRYQKHQEKVLHEFQRLVAIEGENNQNKADRMLQQNPHLASKLITDSVASIRDAAGRIFETPMSAYGYAYWSGDTFMRHMMERYMDEDAKVRALEECERIARDGVNFTLKIKFGVQETIEHVTGSRHFDFQPLIQAYNAWLTEITPLARNWNNSGGARADALWLDIGKEWTKVPTHIAQELCSNRPFNPLPDFKQANIKQTVQFYNWVTGARESIFIASGVHAGLGISFSLIKGDAPGCGSLYRAEARRMGEIPYSPPHADLTAITALCQMRTEAELNQSLNDLKPVEYEARLNR